MNKIWFTGNCKECEFPVLVQPCNALDRTLLLYNDYHWHCTKHVCVNHLGQGTGDMEMPNWVKQDQDGAKNAPEVPRENSDD